GAVLGLWLSTAAGSPHDDPASDPGSRRSAGAPRQHHQELACALIAFAATVGRSPGAAETVLRTRFGNDQLAPVILRAATSPLTIAGAPGLTQVDLVDDILVLVGKVSAAAQVLQTGLQLRFDGAASIAVPLLETNASKVTFVAEGGAIPVQAFST